jgi:hypothetical protein
VCRHTKSRSASNIAQFLIHLRRLGGRCRNKVYFDPPRVMKTCQNLPTTDDVVRCLENFMVGRIRIEIPTSSNQLRQMKLPGILLICFYHFAANLTNLTGECNVRRGRSAEGSLFMPHTFDWSNVIVASLWHLHPQTLTCKRPSKREAVISQ